MIYKGSFSELILKLLLYKTLPYKDVEELVRKHKQYKNKPSASIRNTLTRLRKKGLVKKTQTGWSSSNLINSVLKNNINELDKIKLQASKNKKNGEIIVMYDIPEYLRSKRDILRDGLKVLDFKQKQQSVWIGPAPLPEEFIKFINDLKITKYINFFKVKEEDIV